MACMFVIERVYVVGDAGYVKNCHIQDPNVIKNLYDSKSLNYHNHDYIIS
jgi:rhamnogalacturonyl hydrolase YesR